MTSATTALASAAVSLVLMSCSGEVDEAIASGCDGLRVMSDVYDPGARPDAERGTFDAALIQGSNGFGAAVELASGSGPDPAPDSLIGLGHEAVRAFSVASYEAPEMNDGDLVWKGEPLTREQQQAVARGLEACEDH